jgi:glycine/D-amino acid oxidase-like deaminating enzyme
MNVTVIGAGVYGAAVAAALARRGVRVTVVDAGSPAGGTSGVTFSWTNSCGKQPRFYHDLNVAGMEAHRRLAAPWYHETGNLEWAADDASRAELRAKVDGVLAYGYEARWVSREEALRLEPDLDPATLPADEIAYFPHEGWVDPPALVDHLLSASGAEVVTDDAVTALDLGVRLASGRRIVADAVVNCAGPRAGEVASLAGLNLPMANLPCTLARTAPTAVSVGRVVHAPTVHLRPIGDGRVLLHSPELNGVVDAADELLAAGSALYPGLRGTIVAEFLVGERPIPADGLPVLGRSTEAPGFYFAVSHSGVTLCLHVGDLVAAEVTGEDRDDVLAPYRLERFSLR